FGAGSDDARVNVTREGANTWTKWTSHITDMPEWATVDCIEPSPFDAGTAYLVVDAHRLDNMKPYLYMTNDFGETWKSLSAALPQDIYLHAVREDPVRRGMLYVGTERGVAYSTDEGGTWQQLRLNLPAVAVHDLRVKNNELVLGTHGRSIWIFDNLSVLREMSPQIVQSDVHFFSVQPSIRWHYHGSFHAKPIGQNPPAGAIIDYYLKEKPEGKITLEIRDAKGALVNTFTSKPAKKKKAADASVAAEKTREKVETPEKKLEKPEKAEEEEPEDDPD